LPCARSSVDRALASGARGHRFESCRAYSLLAPHRGRPNSPVASDHVTPSRRITITPSRCWTEVYVHSILSCDGPTFRGRACGLWHESVRRHSPWQPTRSATEALPLSYQRPSRAEVARLVACEQHCSRFGASFVTSLYDRPRQVAKRAPKRPTTRGRRS
jgi:hypothetical protein